MVVGRYTRFWNLTRRSRNRPQRRNTHVLSFIYFVEMTGLRQTLRVQSRLRPLKRETRLAWMDQFFEQPVCRKCAAPSSPRSEKPLHLTHAPRLYDGAFGHVGHEGSTTIQIFSEEFFSLLSPNERQHLIFRPTIRARKSRAFSELIGPSGPPFVAVKGLSILGWRCSACNHSRWGYLIDGLSIHSFVARCDLPQLPGVFTVGTLPEVHLCATAARWRELVGRKGVRGFVSRALGVAPDREIVRRPVLPTYEELLAARR
jgi:hypothetical protein